MKIYKFAFLFTLTFLLNCTNSNDYKNLETEIQELKIRVHKIEQNTKVENDAVIVSENVNKNINEDETTSNQYKVDDQSNFDKQLLRDLANNNTNEVAVKWSNLYDELPKKYQNEVVTTRLGSFKMEYGDLYGLNKGFYWGLCDNYNAENLANYITEEYGATGGKSKIQEINGYRAGMVFFYVKYKILNC